MNIHDAIQQVQTGSDPVALAEYLLEAQARPKPDSQIFAQKIREKYGIEFWLSPARHGDAFEPHIVTLDSIVVPKDNRGTGVGSKAMEELVTWADDQGLILSLDPSSDFGGKVSKLRTYYKRFGFVSNKGRNKDFRTRNAFIRYPKKKLSEGAARFNSKRTQDLFKWIGDCASVPGGSHESINDMRDEAVSSDFKTLSKLTDLEAWAKKHHYDGAEDKDDGGFYLENDWHVGYHRSQYLGVRCYFLTWSGYEHIFVPKGQVQTVRKRASKVSNDGGGVCRR